MKNLPCACYKRDVYEKLNDVSTEHVTEELNKIIASTRDIDLIDAKKKKKITKKECKAVLEAFGELE